MIGGNENTPTEVAGEWNDHVSLARRKLDCGAVEHSAVNRGIDDDLPAGNGRFDMNRDGIGLPVQSLVGVQTQRMALRAKVIKGLSRIACRIACHELHLTQFVIAASACGGPQAANSRDTVRVRSDNLALQPVPVEDFKNLDVAFRSTAISVRGRHIEFARQTARESFDDVEMNREQRDPSPEPSLLSPACGGIGNEDGIGHICKDAPIGELCQVIIYAEPRLEESIAVGGSYDNFAFLDVPFHFTIVPGAIQLSNDLHGREWHGLSKKIVGSNLHFGCLAGHVIGTLLTDIDRHTGKVVSSNPDPVDRAGPAFRADADLVVSNASVLRNRPLRVGFTVWRSHQ